MFTGIIRAIGTVVALQHRGNEAGLRINSGKLDLAEVHVGDSIAVSGACLTVTHVAKNVFDFDVSQETLSRTTLGDLRPGGRVNLEPALTLKDHLGGHLTSGHCDGVGTVLERMPAGESVRFSIRAPVDLAKYIAGKGSICIDGVSLAVNGVKDNLFEVNIIPHTLQATTLNEYQPGWKVNLEVDLLARYLERLLLDNPAVMPRQSIDETILARYGFDK